MAEGARGESHDCASFGRKINKPVSEGRFGTDVRRCLAYASGYQDGFS
jgi:hypothetical protein